MCTRVPTAARREAKALADKELTDRVMQERGERLAMVTGGLLQSLYNKRARVLRTVYVSIKLLLGIMETNPAVKRCGPLRCPSRLSPPVV
jgi:hypothetical protein